MYMYISIRVWEVVSNIFSRKIMTTMRIYWVYNEKKIQNVTLNWSQVSDVHEINVWFVVKYFHLSTQFLSLYSQNIHYFLPNNNLWCIHVKTKIIEIYVLEIQINDWMCYSRTLKFVTPLCHLWSSEIIYKYLISLERMDVSLIQD